MVEQVDQVAVEVQQMDLEEQAPVDKVIMVEHAIQADHMQAVVVVARAVLVVMVHKIPVDQAV